MESIEMKRLLLEIEVRKYYLEIDLESYETQLLISSIFAADLIEHLNQYPFFLNVKSYNLDKTDPNVTIYIDYQSHEESGIKIAYESCIMVSKILNMIYLSHSYQIHNPDKNALNRHLSGQSSHNYFHKNQLSLETILIDFNQNYKYNILNDGDYSFIVSNFSTKKGNRHQIMLGHLLFDDMSDLIINN